MSNLHIPLFKLPNLNKGIFLSRPNRFVSEIRFNNEIKLAHIHDPGRLKELLNPGVEVQFTDSKGKLDYYVKAVKTNEEWVLIDTSLHSKVAMEIFRHIPELSNYVNIKKEVKVGNSRIDFTLDNIPLEVKGVTLVKGDLALFPDAPTKRGARHVQEIIEHKGMLLFLVFRKALRFKPNFKTDPEFSKLLAKAKRQKIKIFVEQISFDGLTLFYEGKIALDDF